MDCIHQTILNKAQENYDYVVELRRHFHRHPELSAKEYQTAERIEKELDQLGIVHKRVGDTGVYGEIHGTGKGEKTIILRADTDALAVEEAHECVYKSLNPGVMHACGHDGHTAGLLGATKILAAHRELFGGTVRLAFQQGEECGYGAKIFIAEGCLDGVDRSFGIHLASNVEVGKVVAAVGPNNASVDWFRITVKGKSAHITSPEQGADALYVGAQIASSVHAISCSSVNPSESLLVGVGRLTAGTTYNVIAAQAELEGTVRAFSPATRAKVKERIQRLAESLAAPYGCTAEIEWRDYTSPLINDERATEEVRATAAALFGREKIIFSRPPSLGGDDFAEFILKAPGMYAFVGSRNPAVPETCEPHHSATFDIDERALVIAASLYAAYAVDFLNGAII